MHSLLSFGSSEQRGMDMAEAHLTLPLGRQNRSSSNGQVAIFWDMTSCPGPESVIPANVECNIRKALAGRNINGSIMSFAAYGNPTTVSKEWRKGLQNTGIKFFDIIEDKKNAVGMVMLVDMCLFEANHTPSSIIVLISNNDNFASALDVFKQNRHIIILVIPNVLVSIALHSAGKFVWDWPSLAHGKAIDLSSEVIRDQHGAHYKCHRRTDMVEVNLAPQPPLYQQKSTSSKVPVRIFWDIENCSIPKNVCPESIVPNISKALACCMTNEAIMSFDAYGDVNALTDRVRKGCRNTGVRLVDVPNVMKDAAERAILVDMFQFAKVNRPPSVIMLISGDGDFARALHILGQRGHTIIVVIHSDKDTPRALRTAGRYVLYWDSVAHGQVSHPLLDKTGTSRG